MEPTGTLTEADWGSHRAAVFGAAYRILGSVVEAEDVTQEVWLRASAADLSEVRDLRAWLVTVAARTAYNVLKSARVRREAYVGPWLPEPLLTGPDTADEVLMDELVSTAMLVVMERLSPAERVALVLHDVFDFPFGQVAEVLGGTAFDAEHTVMQACQHATLLGKVAGYNAAADLLGVPLRDFTPGPYVTCLDLGGAGAIFTRGWDRRVMASGADGAAVKKRINQHIHPPVDDAAKILAAAGRVYLELPFFPRAEEKAVA